jgi:hypothetical protein
MERVMTDAVVVRYRTKPDAAGENQRLIEAVFAQLAEIRPAELRYTAYRLEDGVTFVHAASGAGRAALGELSAFQEFQAGLGGRVESGPDATPAVVVGEY